MQDEIINIAIGMSAKSLTWRNTQIKWSEIAKKLCTEHKTNETFKEYTGAKKDEQGKIKDVGGYVGGYLQNGKRSPKNVIYRQLITLDIDFAHSDFWDDFTMIYGNSAVLHSTHSHTEASPRYRLIMPLSREVTPDEYVAISRKIAGTLGIELFDNTTFETNRLMFWPSNSIDVEYYCKRQNGEFIDADEVLNSYIDWTDTSLWPTASKRFDDVNSHIGKQENPCDKKGIVGFFCKAYSITEAIDNFLSDVYTSTVDVNRYTYIKGTTSGGLMIYDDIFAFSHHGTDPCSGRLSNAFDLVRIHLFGHFDKDEANTNKSFSAMEDLCLKDIGVKRIIAAENINASANDFTDDFAEDNIEWMTTLEIDSRGDYLSSSFNMNLIFANDSNIKGRLRQNTFDNRRYIYGSVPWRTSDNLIETFSDVDFSGIRNYLDTTYGVSGPLKVDDALNLVFDKNKFHPIRDYLNSLEWDGTKRIDNLLIDFFGAKDTLYVREAIRKTLVGAVARVFNPGCKFDLVLVIVGEQGTMKSTFLKKLGKEWFSDTFFTVQGKEALEQIQGHWIIELAELSGLRKADIESTKHFITKQEDSFRAAYARTTQVNKRQCVFIGTTNEGDFLNDSSGNRRFNPIDVNKNRVTKDIFHELDPIVDQIWAEATVLYNKGEQLILSGDAETIANKEQLKHSKTDDRQGVIEQYLDTLLPENWDSMDLFQRRLFYENDALTAKGVVQREFVCIAEVWCECLLRDKDSMTRYNTRDINEILKSIDGWSYIQSQKNFTLYGKQKFYKRK